MATYYKPTFNIDLTLLEPGAIATNFTNAVLGHVQQTAGILDDEYKPMISRYLESFQARNSPPPPQTAESVADVVWELLPAGDEAAARPHVGSRGSVLQIQGRAGPYGTRRAAEYPKAAFAAVTARAGSPHNRICDAAPLSGVF